MPNVDIKSGGWKVGATRRVITPQEPIWIAGYARRTEPSAGVLQDIHARALALQQGDDPIAVLLCTDLLGFDRAILESLRNGVQQQLRRVARTARRQCVSQS